MPMLELDIGPEEDEGTEKEKGDGYAEIARALEAYEKAKGSGDSKRAARAFCTAIDLHMARDSGPEED